MRPIAHAPALLALPCTLVLVGCAATIPSISSGTTAASFGAASDVPKRIMINSQRIQVYDPVGRVLRAELPALGLAVVEHDADAVLAVKITYSDFSPVHLDLTLSSAKTGHTLWSANISRKWDVYASVVSASESNAKKAVELLRQDIAITRHRK